VKKRREKEEKNEKFNMFQTYIRDTHSILFFFF